MLDKLDCIRLKGERHRCLMAVMAPLIVEDNEWDALNSLLSDAKKINIEAVTVDIWWGKVMVNRHEPPNWEYYKKLFKLICNHGLDIVPIFSLHQCGGSRGDRDDKT